MISATTSTVRINNQTISPRISPSWRSPELQSQPEELAAAEPATPGGPRGPWSPLGPWSPFSPLGPWGPIGPCGPTMLSPGGPVGPWGPCGPTGPSGPWNQSMIIMRTEYNMQVRQGHYHLRSWRSRWTSEVGSCGLNDDWGLSGRLWGNSQTRSAV